MLIKVRVNPGAKNEEIAKISEDAFRISVRQKPKNNEANFRTIELLAEYFSVPVGKIRLIKGARAPHKIFEIKKITTT